MTWTWAAVLATTTGIAIVRNEYDVEAKSNWPQELTKNFPFAFLNWMDRKMDGQMDGEADISTRGVSLLSGLFLLFPSHKWTIDLLCDKCALNEHKTAFSYHCAQVKPSTAERPAEAPELPPRHIRVSDPPSFIAWGSTQILPPLLISANYSAVHHSLPSSHVTSAWNAWPSAVTQRPVPVPTGQTPIRHLPQLCIFHVTKWTHTAPLCGQQTNNSQTITFCVCVSVNKVFFFSFTLRKALMFVITHLRQNNLRA